MGTTLSILVKVEHGVRSYVNLFLLLPSSAVEQGVMSFMVSTIPAGVRNHYSEAGGVNRYTHNPYIPYFTVLFTHVQHTV